MAASISRLAATAAPNVSNPCPAPASLGTCRMGTGKLAVADPRLKVHGLGGLRVVGAPVMRAVTTGHANAPAVMTAERGRPHQIRRQRADPRATHWTIISPVFQGNPAQSL
jgi:choline dehydrogenase-like flavoprotein